MLTFEKPAGNDGLMPGFQPAFKTTGAILIRPDGTFLLLRRAEGKMHAGRWGAPGGKVLPDEAVLQANCRETYEETGLRLSRWEYWGFAHVRHGEPAQDFEYHLFSSPVMRDTEVRLSHAEHTSYAWVGYERALALPLVPDMHQCLMERYQRILDWHSR